MKDFERSPVIGAFFLISAIPAFLFRAYVFSILWGWFLIDAIRVEPINTFQAAGILYVWAMLTFNVRESLQEEDEKAHSWFRGLAWMWFSPAGVLFFGWVIKHFI